MTVVASYLLRARCEPGTTEIQLRIVQVEDPASVVPVDGTFLLRVLEDAAGAAHRYWIRHIASGRETYVPGDRELDAFVAEFFQPTAKRL